MRRQELSWLIYEKGDEGQNAMIVEVTRALRQSYTYIYMKTKMKNNFSH